MSLADIQNALVRGDYEGVEAALAQFSPPDTEPYLGAWYQGLCTLLQGDEDTAQGIWFGTLMELEESMTETATESLCEILQDFATFKTQQQEWQTAWVLCQYVAEINPDAFNNRFALLGLTHRLGLPEELISQGEDILTALSHQSSFNAHPLNLAESIAIFENETDLQALLLATGETSYVEQLIKIATTHPTEIETLKQACCEYLGKRFGTLPQRLKIAEYLEALSQNDFPRLTVAILFYYQIDAYNQAIRISEHFLATAETLEDKIAGYYFLIQSLLKSGSQFERVLTLQSSYQESLNDLLSQPAITNLDTINNLIILPSFFGYLRDQPAENNHIKQVIAARFTDLIQENFPVFPVSGACQLTPSNPINRPRDSHQPIRIGYLSECLRRHSVGYLVRDLFKYHDRTQFEITAYTFQNTGDVIQQEIINSSCFFKILENTDPQFIYDLMINDGIDILVDLDSLTSKQICRILALKPAPIQVSWLGYDAAELPTVDYFLVDPYVVPEPAQAYYREKLWHFPHTYVSVYGFEVGVSPLRREDLKIPPDAVVYFCSQTGYKRNPDNIRQQLKILKAVPKSYFLIKSYYSEFTALRDSFRTLAAEEGVDFQRLIFLEKVAEEDTHRAILSLADIVLDTYPYNGATTTLEALWLGIPVVTQVGQQFSARTSYSALMNVGITTGIAWTEAEYIQWGIELGCNATLRQKVSLQLHDSRYHKPLWNSRRFTQDLEQAYQSMLSLNKSA